MVKVEMAALKLKKPVREGRARPNKELLFGTGGKGNDMDVVR